MTLHIRNAFAANTRRRDYAHRLRKGRIALSTQFRGLQRCPDSFSTILRRFRMVFHRLLPRFSASATSLATKRGRRQTGDPSDQNFNANFKFLMRLQGGASILHAQSIRKYFFRDFTPTRHRNRTPIIAPPAPRKRASIYGRG